METHLVLLGIAREDLKAAICLLDRKLYPHSVFHMQQSTEKALKSLGVWIGAISESDAKDKIKHRAYKILDKFRTHLAATSFEIQEPLLHKLEKLGIVERDQIEEFRKGLALMDKEESQLLSNLDGILTDDKLALGISFSNETLQYLLSAIHKQKEELEKQREERLAEVPISEKEVRGLLEEFSPELLVDQDNVNRLKEDLHKVTSEEMQNEIREILRDNAELEFKMKFSWSALAVLSIAFPHQHATKTRYPEGTFNPLDVYNSGMPLIQILPSFFEIADGVYAMLEDVYAGRPR